MSKFCGIWYFDSRPVSAEDIARVRIALDAPGYRAPLEHQAAGLVAGWAAGSDVRERAGITLAPDGAFCLWDGRLDNRNDLMGRQTGPACDPADSGILLGLYRKKGLAGLGAAVGDFSCAIWDPSKRLMVLASDFAGVRPLYYHRTAACLLWSTSLADLVCWSGVDRLDDAYIANFLGCGGAAGRTPYAGICPAPPGCTVSIGAGTIETQAFWSLPAHRETRYPEERDYEEHLLELFRESVRGRMSVGAAVWAELSGGFDSSSVVCMAERLQRQWPGPPPAITTISYTLPGSADEKFMREVERTCGLPSLHVEVEAGAAMTPDVVGVLPVWWEPRFREQARRMAEAGAGVLLTGQAGDLIMGNLPDETSQTAYWLARRRYRDAAREAYAWAKTLQAPIYPILWRGIREAWFSWVPPVNPREAVGAIRGSAEDSVTETFRAGMASEREDDARWREVPPGRRRLFRAVAGFLESRRLQTPEALQHISVAHPYVHRPLVEFMLTIPPRVVFGPNEPRGLMRRAFRDLLPPLVLKRKSKAVFGTAFRDPAVELAASLLADPSKIELVDRGYLDRESLLARLLKLTQGLECNEEQLRQALLLEGWLRSRRDPQPRTPRTPAIASTAPTPRC